MFPGKTSHNMTPLNPLYSVPGDSLDSDGQYSRVTENLGPHGRRTHQASTCTTLLGVLHQQGLRDNVVRVIQHDTGGVRGHMEVKTSKKLPTVAEANELSFQL